MLDCCLLAVCYHRSSRQSPFFATHLRLSGCVARSSLYTANILLMKAYYSRLPFCCSMLAIGCLLLAVRFLVLAALLSFLVTRPLGAPCVFYLLQHARYYLFATHRPTVASVFSPRVVRSSLHVLADCSSLLAVCYSLLTK